MDGESVVDDRTWVFHRDQPAKIVTFAEAEVLRAEGWRESPTLAAEVVLEVAAKVVPKPKGK